MGQEIIQMNEPQTPTPTIDPQKMIVDIVVGTASEAMKSVTDYLKCKQEQVTERKRISATLKVITTQIEANKEMYIIALEKNYEYREKMYNLADKALQHAININDTEAMKSIFNFILTSNGQSDEALKIISSQNKLENNKVRRFIE